MNKIKLTGLICVTLFFWSCHSELQPIQFGTDICAECRMTIVDQHFGAELITQKGKIFKYDSGECLIRYLHKAGEPENRAQAYFVIDYTRPGSLIPVEDAFFLQCQLLSSPMGEFLSAFGQQDSLSSYQDRLKGISLNWTEAFARIK